MTTSTGAIDNSFNIHAFNNKSLFIGDMCPHWSNADIITVVKINKPKETGLAQILLRDINNSLHAIQVFNTLYFYSSLVSVTSISKLGINMNDNVLNIKLCPAHAIFA